MHFRLSAAAGIAAAMLLWPSLAVAQTPAPCCEKKAMPCCETHNHGQEASAIDILLALDPQINPAAPVRQTTEVWFTRPTMIGRSILQGRYVIEHDNERMARGEPCTHVYAFNDRQTPVAAFHCTHLERDRAGQNTVVLITLPDGMQKLTEFQFAGETAAHGYPTVR